MKDFKHKPFALIRTGYELARILPKYLKLNLEDDAIYGIVLDVKNLDRVDGEHKVFMEYLFGKDEDVCVCGHFKPDHCKYGCSDCNCKKFVPDVEKEQ